MEKDIGKIKKSETTDIIVRIDDYKGKKGLTIREYVTSEKYTGFSKSGTRIPADEFLNFRDMINSINLDELTASTPVEEAKKEEKEKEVSKKADKKEKKSKEKASKKKVEEPKAKEEVKKKEDEPKAKEEVEIKEESEEAEKAEEEVEDDEGSEEEAEKDK